MPTLPGEIHLVVLLMISVIYVHFALPHLEGTVIFLGAAIAMGFFARQLWRSLLELCTFPRIPEMTLSMHTAEVTLSAHAASLSLTLSPCTIAGHPLDNLHGYS